MPHANRVYSERSMKVVNVVCHVDDLTYFFKVNVLLLFNKPNVCKQTLLLLRQLYARWASRQYNSIQLLKVVEYTFKWIVKRDTYEFHICLPEELDNVFCVEGKIAKHYPYSFLHKTVSEQQISNIFLNVPWILHCKYAKQKLCLVLLMG